MTGKVYLVGAGPGAADLMTLRGLRLLQKADVVLYDRLIAPELLAQVPLKATRVYVGKEPQACSQRRQERIYTLMIGYARAGKCVVRLKGGDPFVFGRGGEEMERLAQFGIKAEIVPGISSCIAGPGSVNIPVTHRGLSASFGVFAGHPADHATTPEIDWRAAAGLGTAIFLMGVERLPLIVEKLMQHGRPSTTPVALVEKASWSHARQVSGTLADIVPRAAGIRPPAVIVVGEVVGFAESLEQYRVSTEGLHPASSRQHA